MVIFGLRIKLVVEMAKGIKERKPMASELLKQVEEIVRFVEKTDVKELSDWLLADTERPLICVGNGGKRTSYGSFLYEIVANVARTVTPLEFASMAPAVIQKSKVLLLSTSGDNMDIKHAAKRALEHNRDHTACITFSKSEKNAVMKMMGGKNCFLFENDYKDGFVSIRGKFLLFALFYKAFTGAEKFSDKLCYERDYKLELNGGEGELPDMSKVTNLSILYGSYGKPVAEEIEAMMAEGGAAAVTISDYRNYCHGRFIYAGNHTKSNRVPQTDVCMIMLITPRERKLANGVRKIAVATNTPVVEIETDRTDALATIQLLISSFHFLFEFSEKYHLNNPNDPTNLSGIDKRKPKSAVSYVTDLESFGDLTL